MGAPEIPLPWLGLGYSLLLFPLGLLLWARAPLVKTTLIALVRMTAQLFFVGLYLQVVFQLNNPWLTGAWLVAMILMADVSITRGCELRLRRFVLPLFVALAAGTAVPLFYFTGLILRRPHLLDAQFAIPIGGMILGNCLRADIIALRDFYQGLRKGEKTYLYLLSQGARLHEATRPFFRDACRAAMAPTIATIATIGLVALPGMITGVILAGANPLTAIKYQIMIMISILSGTAITVGIALRLTTRTSFDAYGILDRRIFRGE